MLEQAAAAGADMIELGLPFSDPVADGPVIQASSHAALAGGMTVAGALALVAEARPPVPVILMSYLNPLLRYGLERFAADAAAAGVAGVLVTDLPAGADAGSEAALRSSGLPLVRLVAPNTAGARLAEVIAAAEGFVYLVTRLGVTGAGQSAASLGETVAAIRRLTPLPVAAGFGIAAPADAARLARLADGVVVGSALVRRLGEGGVAAGVGFVRELRAALDAGVRAA